MNIFRRIKLFFEGKSDPIEELIEEMTLAANGEDVRMDILKDAKFFFILEIKPKNSMAKVRIYKDKANRMWETLYETESEIICFIAENLSPLLMRIEESAYEIKTKRYKKIMAEQRCKQKLRSALNENRISRNEGVSETVDE
jgi:hypothetical protein